MDDQQDVGSAVKKEFELFCKIGLDEGLRAAAMAVPEDSLGLEETETGDLFCPRERRNEIARLRGEVLDKDGEIEQIFHVDMPLGQFVRLRGFLERFNVEQVRALQESL